ncbi:MAG: NADH-ubiquinone oxidoreductase-F iron-sulfur binding region domain-containing protein [candidate division KSB1 bacterium]|nr:NADH-ubiquinone oxidoreductase-F iron-sulfur binding region domain-containing protein [candidate division KSB1 bacterium]
MKGAFCGLGQAAPIPVLGCLNHFRKDFLAVVQTAASEIEAA